MANVFRQATSWLYTGLAVTILGTWTLIILFLVGLTALNQDPGLLQLIALPSLLTFLVAKLVVAVSAPAPARTTPAPGNLATWLATADNGSPHGALVLFLFSVTWLLHLARVVFMMFLTMLMGGFFLFAAALDAVDKEDTATGGEGFFDSAGERDNFTTALVEFEEQVGITFGDHIKGNPGLLFKVVVGLWSVSAALMVYIVAHGFAAIRQVLTTPLEAWSRSEAPVRVDGVQQGAAVVVEKERIVLPAGVQAAN